MAGRDALAYRSGVDDDRKLIRRYTMKKKKKRWKIKGLVLVLLLAAVGAGLYLHSRKKDTQDRLPENMRTEAVYHNGGKWFDRGGGRISGVCEIYTEN